MSVMIGIQQSYKMKVLFKNKKLNKRLVTEIKVNLSGMAGECGCGCGCVLNWIISSSISSPRKLVFIYFLSTKGQGQSLPTD